MAVNYKKLFAEKKAIEEQLLRLNPALNHEKGIYIFTRQDNGLKYAYVGQAVNVLDRLVSHIKGYKDHIDRSLKSHKLLSYENPNGWYVEAYNIDGDLDYYEKLYINIYGNSGYQLLNKTTGSQGKDKKGITENSTKKGYYDGVHRGVDKVKAEVKDYFDKYLDYCIKGTPNKIKERKYQQFTEFLGD